MCNVSFVYLNSIAMSSSRPALELKQQTSSNNTRILCFERPFFHHNLFFYFPNYFFKLFHQGTKRSSVSCRWWYKHHYKFIVKSICNCRKFISIYSSPFTFYLSWSSVFRFKSFIHLFIYYHDNISCLALWYFWFSFKPTF